MKIKNFTPLFDQLTQLADLHTAAVYGRIWRYEQGKYKKCSAAVKTIAKELGISEKTVERRIKLLEKMELIEDLTPDRRNAPHDYITTGLVDITLDGTSESLTGKSQSLTSPSESLSQTVTESDEDTIKKQVNKQKKKEKKGAKPPKPKKKRDPLLDHPAIIAHKEIIRLHVPIIFREAVVNVVGDSPASLNKWKQTLRDWIGAGYNPKGIKNILDKFQGGSPKKNQDPEDGWKKYVEGEFGEFIEH